MPPGIGTRRSESLRTEQNARRTSPFPSAQDADAVDCDDGDDGDWVAGSRWKAVGRGRAMMTWRSAESFRQGRAGSLETTS